MIRSIAIVLICLSLAGCGYRPLYGKSGDGPGVVAQLTSIAVPEQKTRAGQLVRNELLSSIAPGGSGAAERYNLNFDIAETSSLVSDKPLTDLQRKRYRLTVSYKLIEIASGNPVASGKSFSDVSYDVIREPIADIRAEADAKERAAIDLAQDLKIRLAAYFAANT